MVALYGQSVYCWSCSCLWWDKDKPCFSLSFLLYISNIYIYIYNHALFDTFTSVTMPFFPTWRLCLSPPFLVQHGCLHGALEDHVASRNTDLPDHEEHMSWQYLEMKQLCGISQSLVKHNRLSSTPWNSSGLRGAAGASRVRLCCHTMPCSHSSAGRRTLFLLTQRLCGVVFVSCSPRCWFMYLSSRFGSLKAHGVVESGCVVLLNACFL